MTAGDDLDAKIEIADAYLDLKETEAILSHLSLYPPNAYEHWQERYDAASAAFIEAKNALDRLCTA